MDNSTTTVINPMVSNTTGNWTIATQIPDKNTTMTTEEMLVNWTDYRIVLVMAASLILGVLLGCMIMFCCMKRRYRNNTYTPKGVCSLKNDSQFVERLRVQYARNESSNTTSPVYDLPDEAAIRQSNKHRDKATSPTETGATPFQTLTGRGTQTDPPRKYSLAKILRTEVSTQTDISNTNIALLENNGTSCVPNNTSLNSKNRKRLIDVFMSSRVVTTYVKSPTDEKNITILDDFPFKKFMESKIQNLEDSIKSTASYVLPDGIVPPPRTDTNLEEDEYINISAIQRKAKAEQALCPSDFSDHIADDYINVLKFKKTASQQEQKHVKRDDSTVNDILGSTTKENKEQLVLIKVTDDILSLLSNIRNSSAADDSDDGDDYIPMNQGFRKHDDMYIAMSGHCEPNYLDSESD